MAINFDSFTTGTNATIQSDDFVVGFDTAVPGGERKWSLSTIANAVSGLIKNEMANYMNNTLTIGNYPYLEYAWVTAPNAAGQSLTPSVSAVATLNTEVADLGGHGTLNNNQITLNAGTYLIKTQFVIDATIGGSSIGFLRNLTNGTIITRFGNLGDWSEWHEMISETQATFNTQTTIDIGVMCTDSGLIQNFIPGYTWSSTAGKNGGQAGLDQRTTIKLWKVG